MIRKIIVGINPKDAMAYYVGMKVGKMVISSIVVDEKYLVRHNIRRYLIYLTGDEGVMLWKNIEGLPVVVEYNLNF
jgi:hypothetical protein|tara:strand:+ start:115 stop:342 length:228 start_codon:yes stop_codon:yes gene_type:complete